MMDEAAKKFLARKLRRFWEGDNTYCRLDSTPESRARGERLTKLLKEGKLQFKFVPLTSKTSRLWSKYHEKFDADPEGFYKS